MKFMEEMRIYICDGNSSSQRRVYEWVGRWGDGRTNDGDDDYVRSWRPSLTNEEILIGLRPK